ncbi:hypothetical protein [Geodermatophilus sp. URMC 64]
MNRREPGRRALARIEKLVAARAAVRRRLDREIGRSVARARADGASWWRIGRALRGR